MGLEQIAHDHNLQAEQSVLGACLLEDPNIVARVREILPPGSFYVPRHSHIWEGVLRLVAHGEPLHPVALNAIMPKVTASWSVQDSIYIVELAGHAPELAGTIEYAASEVAKAAKRRNAALAGIRYSQQLAAGEVDQAVSAMQSDLGEVVRPASSRIVVPTLDELLELSAEEPEYDWLIPGVLERGERVILTGGEGDGKSTLTRQIAVQGAAGIHPFGGDPFDPLNVCVIELENGKRHTLREFRKLKLSAGGAYQNRVRVHVQSGGIDLLSSEDRSELNNLVASAKPDLLIIGPLYKMANGDPIEERTAKPVAEAIDTIRNVLGCAVIIEAHTPYGQTGNNQSRPKRPYGASLWSRWPEFGLHLAREGHLTHWRGDRDERNWPAALKRGGEWPWTPVTSADDLRWAQIVQYCATAGDQLTERDLAELLGCSQPSVHRTIEKHRQQWNSLAADSPDSAS